MDRKLATSPAPVAVAGRGGEEEKMHIGKPKDIMDNHKRHFERLDDRIAKLHGERGQAWEERDALRAAGDELVKKASVASQFVAKYVADTESVIGKRALDNLWAAIEAWRKATGN